MRAEHPGHVIDGELLEVEERLDRHDNLRVLFQHAAEKFFHHVLLREVGVAITRHLLRKIGKAPFSSQKILHSNRHIKSCGTCMEY